MRDVFEIDDFDLGDLGPAHVTVYADTYVTWAREPEDGDDQPHVKIVDILIETPAFDPAKSAWVKVLTGALRGLVMDPENWALKQRLETRLEDDFAERILDSHRNRHVPDRAVGDE